MTDDTLPTMIDGHGEIVRLITADDLLRVAGLDGTALADAELVQLGTFTDQADHLVAIAGEAKRIVGAEAIARMDRRGKWTLREAGFEFNAPSPTAGTTSYDTGLLLAALKRLVAAGAIDQEAADAALELVHGTVTVTAPQLEALAAGIDGDDQTITAALQLHAELHDRLSEPAWKQKPAGINALRKLGGKVAAAIDAAKVEVDPPARTAKIKRRPA